MKKIRDEQKGIIFISLILVIIAVLSVIFSISLKTNKVEDNLKSNEIVRSLFVVEDNDSSVLFSSVLIYNSTTKKAAFINIPSYVGAIYRTIGRVDKISRVYEENGIESFKLEIEKLLAVNIPYYSLIKIEDFKKLTDFLGGVRVFIPEPIDYSSESERFLLPSGLISLDGDKVDTYLHYRLDSERDVDVQERYQNVMTSFITSLHDKKFIIFDKKNFKVFGDSVISNLDDEEEEYLFEVISELETESIIKQTITGSSRNVDGQVLLLPLNNGEFIKEAVKQTTNLLMYTDGTMSSRIYVLEIQNGTTVQGLARNTSILFQNASYDVLSAVNADSNDYEQTVIIDHIGNNEIARMVGEFIHCTNIVSAETYMEEKGFKSESNVDFTIILGKDFNGRYVIQSKSAR